MRHAPSRPTGLPKATPALPAVLVLAVLAGAPGAAEAQYLGGGSKSAAEVQIADLEQVRDKFVSLGGAFPEEARDWRPMEGVRSVRDVLVLVAGEGTLFPTMWGFDAPGWTAEGGQFAAERARLQELPYDELLSEVGRSFDHTLEIVRGLDDEERARRVSFFGLDVELGTAVTLMLNDMHEHLGQLIAYARTNEVVPPWSRPADGGP